MGLLENAAYQVPVANLGERCRKTTRQGLLGREVSVQMRLVEQVPGETPAESLPYENRNNTGGNMCIEIRFEEMPTATLPNGVVVGNFSSEHPFFLRERNGNETIVPACSATRNDAMKLSVTEHRDNRVLWTDLESEFRIPELVMKELAKAQQKEEVDIVLVSWPTMTAWKATGEPLGKLRSCKWIDRDSLRVYADKFYK